MSTDDVPEWRQAVDPARINQIVAEASTLITTRVMEVMPDLTRWQQAALAMEIAAGAIAELAAVWASMTTDPSAAFHSILEPTIQLIHDEGAANLRILEGLNVVRN